MLDITRTACTGYLPMDVSAESMMASVPSKMALATSVVSARVGRTESTIDSSISVAGMTGFAAPVPPAEVAPRHHDTVAGGQDAAEVLDRLPALNLGDDGYFGALLAQHGLHIGDVAG